MSVKVLNWHGGKAASSTIDLLPTHRPLEAETKTKGNYGSVG